MALQTRPDSALEVAELMGSAAGEYTIPQVDSN